MTNKILFYMWILLTVFSCGLDTDARTKASKGASQSTVLKRRDGNSILGRYSCKDSDAVLHFESNGKFGIDQGDNRISGTYRLEGPILTMNLMTVVMTLQFDGNVITDGEGKQWTRNRAGMPDPSKVAGQKVRINFFTFELQECKRSGSSVSCEFVITNEDKDRRLVFGDYNSKLFDDMGNEGRIRNVRLANKTGTDFAEAVMVSGVPVRGRVEFEGTSPRATKISLMTILCFTLEIDRYHRDNAKVEFRNVPLN